MRQDMHKVLVERGLPKTVRHRPRDWRGNVTVRYETVPVPRRKQANRKELKLIRVALERNIP